MSTELDESAKRLKESWSKFNFYDGYFTCWFVCCIGIVIITIIGYITGG